MLKHIPFYASLLDKQISDDIKTTNSHVLVYGAIEVHATGERGCIASDELIGRETGLSDKTVSKIISQLKKAGWIHTNLSPKNKRLSIEPLLEIAIPGALPQSKAESGALPQSNAELYSGVNIDNRDRVQIKEIDKSISKKEKSATPKFNEKDVELTQLLRSHVEINFPSVKEKPLKDRDYETLNKIHRLDGKDYQLIRGVILWSQQDDFWSQNIRSTAKLRLKFNDLHVRAEKWSKQQQRNSGTFKL